MSSSYSNSKLKHPYLFLDLNFYILQGLPLNLELVHYWQVEWKFSRQESLDLIFMSPELKHLESNP